MKYYIILKDIRRDSWKKDNKINIYNYYNDRSHALLQKDTCYMDTKRSSRVELKEM